MIFPWNFYFKNLKLFFYLLVVPLKVTALHIYLLSFMNCETIHNLICWENHLLPIIYKRHNPKPTKVDIHHGNFDLLSRLNNLDWCGLFSRSEYTFLLKHQFEMILHNILSISVWPNQSGKVFWGKIWIFVEVIFNLSAQIGVFRLKFRVTLLSRCHLKTLLIFKRCQNLKLIHWLLIINVRFLLSNILVNKSTVCEKVLKKMPSLAHCTHICQNIKY